MSNENILIAKFKEGDITTYAYGQWQHNWGQILQIEGLDLPTGTQVHFSLLETGGEAIPMVAVRENDVLKVEVPGQLLDNEESLADFNVYAYVYTSDGNSGQTIRKIIIPVEARPDIGVEVPKEEPNPFDLVVEQIKALVAAAAEKVANQIINELKLTDYVKKTDFATSTQAGVGKADWHNGIYMSNGVFTIYRATDTYIDAKSSIFLPITPSNLDYAVMKALTDSKNHTWTDEEKASALALLGAQENIVSKNIGVAVARISGTNGNTNIPLYTYGASNADKLLCGSSNGYGLVEVSNITRTQLEKQLGDYDETKASLQAQVDAKVEKPVAPAQPSVVTMDANGNISTVRYTASAIAYTVAQRTANGTLITAKPTNDNEATNKAYVDDLVGDIETIITELHAYAETLKGGAE